MPEKFQRMVVFKDDGGIDVWYGCFFWGVRRIEYCGKCVCCVVGGEGGWDLFLHTLQGMCTSSFWKCALLGWRRRMWNERILLQNGQLLLLLVE